MATKKVAKKKPTKRPARTPEVRTKTDETLRKIVDTGLRAWLRYDVRVADSVMHTIGKAKLLNLKQHALFLSLCDDFAQTGQARKKGLITGPIDEAALAEDVADVIAGKSRFQRCSP